MHRARSGLDHHATARGMTFVDDGPKGSVDLFEEKPSQRLIQILGKAAFL